MSENEFDKNTFVLQKPKRIKTINFVNELPKYIELEVTLDTTNEMTIRAKNKITRL